MKVSLRLFAGARERMGKDRVDLELPAGTRVQDLRALFSETDLKVLEGYWACSRVAVNYEFSDPQTILKEGDEIALLPPVSGG